MDAASTTTTLIAMTAMSAISHFLGTLVRGWQRAERERQLTERVRLVVEKGQADQQTTSLQAVTGATPEKISDDPDARPETPATTSPTTLGALGSAVTALRSVFH